MWQLGDLLNSEYRLEGVTLPVKERFRLFGSVFRRNSFIAGNTTLESTARNNFFDGGSNTKKKNATEYGKRKNPNVYRDQVGPELLQPDDDAHNSE
jgi:hypothetical protein